MDADGRRWTQMDADGRRWTQINADKRRWRTLICVHLWFYIWTVNRRTAVCRIESSMNVEQIAKRLGLSPERLIEQGVRALLLQEIGELEREIAGLRERYNLLEAEQLHQAIRTEAVAEHPAWEDYIWWEQCQNQIFEMKEAFASEYEYA